MVLMRRLVSCAAATAVVAAVSVGLPGPALADAFLLETSVGANLGCNPAGPYGGPGQCLNDEDPFDFQTFGPDHSYPDSVGAGYISVSNVTDGFADQAFVYFAEADADFGALSARVTGSFDLSSPGRRIAVANAQSIDLLTINAQGLEGTNGTLNVNFTLDGSVSTTGQGFAGAQVGVLWGGDEPFAQEDGVFNFFFGDAVVNVQVPFVYGTPFFLSYFLGTGAGTPIDFTEIVGTGSGSADFFNTLTLTGMQPLDSNLQQVHNAQFSSASGTRYSETGVVPEPATLALTAVGIAGALARAQRRKRL